MVLDGVSIKGSYHEINQDSFGSAYLKQGFVVALSDGLGSKKNSQVGSRALCEAVINVAQQNEETLLKIDASSLVHLVYEAWRERLRGYVLSECCATMLFVIVCENRVIAARLGDGFIGVFLDDYVRVLFDRKDDYFANETDCLTDQFYDDKVEIFDVEISDITGGVMCSDGVGIGAQIEQDYSSFTKEFCEGYIDNEKDEISKDINGWLSTWPGVDDKTIAYFLAEKG